MKKHLPLLVLISIVLFSVSCKKKVEEKKEDLIMSAITDGTWIVEQYFEEGNNISGDFLNYDFRFFKDGSVTGVKSGITTNGTWIGNSSTYTITSTFSMPNDTLVKMNGVWKLTDSYWDYVEAEKTTSTGKNILHLRKKP